MILLVLAFLVAPCTAHAQENVLSIEVLSESGWRYYPATTQNKIVGFLAIQESGAPAPNGFSIVWYEQQPDHSFQASGWTGHLLTGAARVLQQRLGDPKLFTQRAIYDTLISAPQFDPPDTGDFVRLENGLTLDDPLQPVAAMMSPAQMQAAVMGGSRGASMLSADAVDHSRCRTKDRIQLCSTAHFMENRLFGSPIEGSCCETDDGDGWWCFPGPVTSDSTTYGPWSAPTVTMGGGCSYSRTVYTNTSSCYQNWDCSLTGCTNTTTTTLQTKICPPLPSGACSPTPPPGC